jgi:hypothetical protein
VLALPCTDDARRDNGQNVRADGGTVSAAGKSACGTFTRPGRRGSQDRRTAVL